MNPHHPKKGAAGWGENRGERIAAGDEAHQEDPSLVSDAVAKHMLVLVEVLTPRVVISTIEELRKRGMLIESQPRDGNVRRAVMALQKNTGGSAGGVLNSKGLAEALGCSTWLIGGVKKRNAELAAQGLEEPIFTGRYSTPSKVSRWLADHPEFIPTNVILAPEVRAEKAQMRQQRSG